MAFYFTADSSQIVASIGHYEPLAVGSAVLSGGSATVTVPQAYVVKSAFCSSQTSNAARCSATSGNTFTITGTGTDRVDWIAFIQPRA